MFIIGYFLQALAALLDVVLTLATFAIIARAVLSWVSPDPHNPIVRIIVQITEPLLFPIRRRVPYLGGIDFSPVIAILALMFLESFLVPSLTRIAVPMIQGG